MSQEKKKKVRRVLEWLRSLLAWWSQNPLERMGPTLEQLEKNKDLVRETISEVIEPEFQEYVGFVSGLITINFKQSGEVEGITEGNQGTGNKADS